MELKFLKKFEADLSEFLDDVRANVPAVSKKTKVKESDLYYQLRLIMSRQWRELQ